jgi:Peptidase_C39 like family
MPRHHTEIQVAPRLDGNVAGEFGREWATGGWTNAPFRFSELLVSWNVKRPADSGFVCEIRVRDQDADPSPWLEIGIHGPVPRQREREIDFAGGRIDVDWFRGSPEARFRAVQARFRATAGRCRLDRLAFCFTERDSGASSAAAGARLQTSDLAVPFRSQRSAVEELRGRICSPTSLSMVLAYHGVERAPEVVAAEVFDDEHDVYGNWPRSIQTAYEAGVAGVLTRFSDWSEVGATLANGRPIIASIGVQSGQLTGAPYESTQGHLIVLRGIDEAGDVRVNDPAAGDAASGRRVYRRDELDVVWMQRGGTAYLLLPPLDGDRPR